MNFKPLSDLYLGIAAQTAGLNEDSALDELRRAARTFCRDTLISQETFDTSIAPGDRSIFIDPPSGQVKILRALWVTTPEGKLQIETLDWLNNVPGWRSATGMPTCCAADVDGELALSSAPATTIDPVHVRVAYLPSLVATQLDAVLVDEWGEAIQDLALHRILRMPNQTWSNPGAAEEARVRYSHAESAAKAAAATNRSVAPIRTPIPRFC